MTRDRYEVLVTAIVDGVVVNERFTTRGVSCKILPDGRGYVRTDKGGVIYVRAERIEYRRKRRQKP